MASAVRTYLNRYAAAPARRIALFTNNEDGWRTVETPRSQPGSRSPPSSMRAPMSRPAAARAGGEARLRRAQRRGRSESTAARTASRKISVALGRRRARRDRGRRACRFRRLEPGGRADLVSSRPADDGATTSPPSCRTARRRAWSRQAPPTAPFGSPTACAKGHAAGAAAAADLGFSARHGRRAVAGRRSVYALTPLWHVAGQEKGLRRFPERRHRVRHRAGRSARASSRSSI